jgi:hypothetical protein
MVRTSVQQDQDDVPLSPAESLQLIAQQESVVARRLWPNVTWFYGPWGLAYLLGFGAVYLSYPTWLPFELPDVAASITCSVLFTAAIASSLVTGARIGRGVEGPSRRVGAMHGWSYLIGFASLAAINAGLLHAGLPSDTATLLWSGTTPMLVGVLYLSGGALWQDRFQYGLGVWMCLTGTAGVLAGVPENFAVLSLAGGGGLLLAAAYFGLSRRRAASGT